MSTKLSDALAPLAARMPRAARDVEILRVSAQLDGDDFAASSEDARRAVLAWAQKRAGGKLPAEAWQCEDFDLTRGGRNSTGVRIKTDDTDLWALRAEDPDKNVPGRVWSTEVVIGGAQGVRPYLSLRLIVSTSEADLSIEPHVPGTVLQISGSPGLVHGGRPLVSEPRLVSTENEAEDLCDHLEDPERRLPIFVVTLAEDGAKPLIDDVDVARAATGIARVVRLTPEACWTLTRRLGKRLSVFGGAVRAYMPGFSSYDDPFRHRLFLAESLAEQDHARQCASWLRKSAAALSVSSTRLGKDVLEFSAVRTANRHLRTKALRESAASDTDMLEAAFEEIRSLEDQLVKKEEEIDGYLSEIESAEARAETSEQEARKLIYQVRQLREAPAESSPPLTAEPPLPQQWSEFIDWVDTTYPDSVALTPAARKMVRAPEFDDVSLVARSVSWLAKEQRDRRLHGGGSLRDAHVEQGIYNTLCGGDSYETVWRGRRYSVDWHIKTGGNTRDPKTCLRIYYFWEPELQLAVIDHLPSHRTTAAS